MKITFLGTGNAAGIPVYGCTCATCNQAQANKELHRQPACLLVEHGHLKILIDAGIADIGRRYPAEILNHILLTHYHIDHVSGLFPLRWGKNISIPVIGPNDPQGCDDLFKHPGILDFSNKAQPFKKFKIADIEITPLPLIHSRPTLGYLFKVGHKSFAYLTDTSDLPVETIKNLKTEPPTLLILDCEEPPQPKTPRNHNDLTTALQIHKEIKPERTILTHISDKFDNWRRGNDLPENIIVAADMMPLDL